jgi:hypothetical protein
MECSHGSYCGVLYRDDVQLLVSLEDIGTHLQYSSVSARLRPERTDCLFPGRQEFTHRS